MDDVFTFGKYQDYAYGILFNSNGDLMWCNSIIYRTSKICNQVEVLL